MNSSTALSQVERVLVQQNVRSKSICARCFHASRLQRSDGPSNANAAAAAAAAAAGTASSSSSAPRALSMRRQKAARVTQSLAQVASSDSRPRQSSRDDSRSDSSGSKSRRGTQDNPFTADRTRPTAFKPVTADSLLKSGSGTATIANGDYEGVVRDRLKMVMKPGVETSTFKHDGPVPPKTLGSYAEESGYMPSQRTPTIMRKQKYANFLTERYVAGEYDGDRVLHHEAGKHTELLDIVEKAVTMNSTYLRRDGDRFYDKVKSLLPTVKANRDRLARKANAAT